MADSIERICDMVEGANVFCYLGDRLNAADDCKAAVTARVKNRLGEIQKMWKMFTSFL